MIKKYFLPVLIMAILVTVNLSSCSKGSSMNNTASNTKMVTMQNMSFSIVNLTVTAGMIVTWTNIDNTTHTVTADDSSFNSGDILAGHSFAKTFNSKGTFPYHCIYHSMMKASVLVN